MFKLGCVHSVLYIVCTHALLAEATIEQSLQLNIFAIELRRKRKDQQTSTARSSRTMRKRVHCRSRTGHIGYILLYTIRILVHVLKHTVGLQYVPFPSEMAPNVFLSIVMWQCTRPPPIPCLHTPPLLFKSRQRKRRAFDQGVPAARCRRTFRVYLQVTKPLVPRRCAQHARDRKGGTRGGVTVPTSGGIGRTIPTDRQRCGWSVSLLSASRAAVYASVLYCSNSRLQFKFAIASTLSSGFPY